MTLFIDLKDKVKQFFVLQSQKTTDGVWGGYLRSETKYINGAVYLSEIPPTVHKQELSFATFTVGQNNSVVCLIGAKNENFSTYQARRTVATLNNNPCKISSSTISGNVIRVEVESISASGNLKVQIPAYNDKNNVYSGLTVERSVTVQ